MILTKDLLDDLLNLENNIHSLTLVQNPNNLQIESFLRNLEKRRYSILNQIKLYNKTVTYETQKITTISDEYNAKFEDNILKIYIPEVMPSYKNLKTHAYKNILLNIADKIHCLNWSPESTLFPLSDNGTDCPFCTGSKEYPDSVSHSFVFPVSIYGSDVRCPSHLLQSHNR